VSARPIVLAKRWTPSDRERLAQAPESVCGECGRPVVIHRALADEVRAKPHLHQVICHECWERTP
jgi:hypothetical protein